MFVPSNGLLASRGAGGVREVNCARVAPMVAQETASSLDALELPIALDPLL